MLFGVILVFIDAEDDGYIFILRRSRDEHLPGTTLEVSGCTLQRCNARVDLCRVPEYLADLLQLGNSGMEVARKAGEVDDAEGIYSRSQLRESKP